MDKDITFYENFMAYPQFGWPSNGAMAIESQRQAKIGKLIMESQGMGTGKDG